MSSIQKIFPLDFQWKTQDPFLFCAYHKDLYPKGNNEQGPDSSLLAGRAIGHDFTIKDGWRMYHGQKIPGFPQHPHRGFETITIVPEGMVDHSDSLGATGRFGDGDVQWMTAGKGVLHSEMFPLVNSEDENPLLLFQIWLNLPRKSKFVEPHYKMLWKEDIPEYKKDGVVVKVIAGRFGEVEPLRPTPDSWAADQVNDVAVWLISIKEKGELELPLSADGTNRSIYLYAGGHFDINDEKLPSNYGADLDGTKKTILKSTEGEAHLLLLQGRPLHEPVVQQGPFVMNTQQEIYEAIKDYQRTQFGGWPWPKNEFAHPKDSGRFAIHSDGSREER